MIKLSFRRRFILGIIQSIGFLVTFGVPVLYLAMLIKNNIEYVPSEQVKLNWVFGIIAAMFVLLIIYIKLIKKWFNRKLQALAIVTELGAISAKPIIFNRIIKTLEYVYPFIMTLVFLYGMRLLFSQYRVFTQLYTLNLLLLALVATGAIIFLISDAVEISMKNEQKAEDLLRNENKANVKKLKALRKNKVAALKALEVEKEIERLKNE